MMRDGEMIERAEHGQEVEIFLDVTPFYAESGRPGRRHRFDRRPRPGSWPSFSTPSTHCRVSTGTVQGRLRLSGRSARPPTCIDIPRREAIRKSHTGTHVLHWALRDVLGGHAHQAGSLVESGRLRFDFSHFSAVAPQELAEIEALANHRLIENGHVTTTITTKEEAEAMGALAFFGDKYGDTVRLVQDRPVLGRVLRRHPHPHRRPGRAVDGHSESSIGSNIRRIEALTGLAAYQQLVEVRAGLDQVGRMLKVSGPEVPTRVEGLLERIDSLEGELDILRSQRRGELAVELAGQATKVGQTSLLVASAPDLDPNSLRQLALGVRDRLGPPAVVIAGSAVAGKGSLVGVVTKDLVDAGVSAGAIISEAATELGGGGSRDPELAQAGGPHGDRLDDALERARDSAERLIGSL